MLTIKIILIILCLFVFNTGLISVFKPKRLLHKYGLSPHGPNGMSTLRGHLGGTLLAIPILILYGLWNGETIWLMAVGICLYIAVFGRIISILKDGFEKTTAMPLAFEFIIASLVTAYHLASIS